MTETKLLILLLVCFRQRYCRCDRQADLGLESPGSFRATAVDFHFPGMVTGLQRNHSLLSRFLAYARNQRFGTAESSPLWTALSNYNRYNSLQSLLSRLIAPTRGVPHVNADFELPLN